MSTVAERVAAGAAWLDEKYPGWFNSIDLGTLKLSSCAQCVLGQVYSEHIPRREKDELIARITLAYDGDAEWKTTVPRWGGYSILIDALQVEDGGKDLGFAADYNDPTWYTNQYEILLDEWTRVILERRLRAHPDLHDLTCSLAELREPAVVA